MPNGLSLPNSELLQQQAHWWFRHAEVLDSKIRKALLCGADEVERGVVEALKFLWLVASKEGEGLLTPAHRVDLVWHELILFTRTYAEFCEIHFGKFIHHQPGGSAGQNRKQLERTLTAYRLAFGEPLPEFWGSVQSAAAACGTCES